MQFAEQDLFDIRDSGGKYGQYVYDCCRFYHKWHIDSDHFDGTTPITLQFPFCTSFTLLPLEAPCYDICVLSSLIAMHKLFSESSPKPLACHYFGENRCVLTNFGCLS